MTRERAMELLLPYKDELAARPLYITVDKVIIMCFCFLFFKFFNWYSQSAIIFLLAQLPPLFFFSLGLSYSFLLPPKLELWYFDRFSLFSLLFSSSFSLSLIFPFSSGPEILTLIDVLIELSHGRYFFSLSQIHSRL